VSVVGNDEYNTSWLNIGPALSGPVRLIYDELGTDNAYTVSDVAWMQFSLIRIYA